MDHDKTVVQLHGLGIKLTQLLMYMVHGLIPMRHFK
jgi:hypothetical protein